MNEEKKRLCSIGAVRFKDFDAFCDWAGGGGGKQWYEENWKEKFYPRQDEFSDIAIHGTKGLHTVLSSMYGRDSDNTLASLKAKLKYSETYGTSFYLRYTDDFFSIISFGGDMRCLYIIPTDALAITLFKDYSALSLAELHKLSLTGNTDAAKEAPAISYGSLSQKSASENKIKLEAQAKALENEMEDIKAAKGGELEKLRLDIERMQADLAAKQRDAMEILNRKKEEMAEELKKIENQLFVLDSTIYSIRCYLNEVVDFVKLKAGKSAKLEDPIVVYQKLRFLDVELGRLVSIYNADFKDAKMFEELLTVRPDVLETFCPNDKCISLVKISEDGTYKGKMSEINNLLKDYEVYHGKLIGIIVRDGENLYMGWTDDERVRLDDDNVFLTPQTTIVAEGDAPAVTSSKEVVASRLFIFSLLQGLVDNAGILKIPEKENFTQAYKKPLKYIVFSDADKWLPDTRFGDARDIISRSNVNIREGDSIISLQSLRDEMERSGWGWYRSRNERGRGYANRVHDVRVPDCSILTVNLIEEQESYIRYKYPRKTSDGEIIYNESMTRKSNRADLTPDAIILDDNVRNYRYYVSLRKEYSPTARANFEIYGDEFINLTFLNSVWIEYLITNKKPGLAVNGKEANFAYAIRYLNKMLQYLRAREEKEAAAISVFCPNIAEIPDWQVQLSEWKLKHNVHALTAWQAKRFAKTLAS